MMGSKPSPPFQRLFADLLHRAHHAFRGAKAEAHIKAELEELIRRLGDIEAVLARELTRGLSDRHDITRRDPLRISDLLLKCYNDLVGKLGTEEKISKMTDEMWMRINFGTSATISLE